VVSMQCVNVGVCIHVVSLVFFYCCVTHRGVVFLHKVSDQSCRIWGLGRSFVQCEKFSTMCSNLSKVSYCSLWEQFTFGSSLLIMTKYLATVKERKCDIIERNSDHKN